MSRSPSKADGSSPDAYLQAFNELAMKIRDGQSFSGRERNSLFLNTGALRFADASAAADFDFPDDARGSALTDWDGDGALDIWLSNRSAPRARLLLNRGTPRGAWLALRLAGDPDKGTSRDAIGARVEVRTEGDPEVALVVRTLTAGDGFLSQNSKTLHFGLGRATAIRSVTVRWPGGGREEFPGIGLRGTWRLRQGGGAERVAPAPQPAPLAAGSPELPASGETLRLRLSQPLKLPPVAATTLDGQPLDLEALTTDRPVLLNLWATWCAPCAAELRDFATLPDTLTTVALCVDRLDPGNKTDEAAAAAFLKRHGQKGLSGWATAGLVGTMDALIREAVYRHRRLPVPASFLIDKGGWLTVVYKGPVTAEQVRKDLAQIDAGPETALAAAVPFPGAWAARTLFPGHVMAMARTLRESGRPDEALGELERFVRENEAQAGADAGVRRRLADVWFEIGTIRMETDRPEEALTAFRSAALFDPQQPGPAIGILRALSALDRPADLTSAAAPLLDGPAGPDARLILAEHHRRHGRWSEAIDSLRTAIRQNPRFVPGLDALARLLATVPDPALRQPAEALDLANFFMSAPGVAGQHPFVLTLAAAQAASGNADAAAATARRAAHLARTRGDRRFLREHAAALEALADGRPWPAESANADGGVPREN